jgi:hypothetical protein
MYKNPKEWMMTFQSYYMLTLLNLHTQKTTKPIKIIERSLFKIKVYYTFIIKIYTKLISYLK